VPVVAGSGRLPVDQLLKWTGFCRRLIIFTGLDDLSFLDHVDAIGVDDRGERSATTEVVQLLGNACLSPTTLAPKGPFRPRGPGWILLFSLDSVEPHRVTSNDLVGALGAIPAAWWRTSHDVLARLMFSSRADSFSPANRLHPHYQKSQPKCIKG
jgi:hypothetical protein